jgi:hypothetical protein
VAFVLLESALYDCTFACSVIEVVKEKPDREMVSLPGNINGFAYRR